MIFSKKNFSNFVAVIFGIVFSGLIIEIFSRLLPASDLLSLQTPIECLDLNNIDLKCLPRRKSGEKGFYTLGALPPLPVKALKKANDIGQLTNVNFYDFKSKQLQNLPIISIGDSQVAALQVNNEDTFHGLLNQYKIQSGSGKVLPIKSTAIAASGLALPSYLKAIEFIDNNLENINNVYLIIPIISNDFDESFREYQPTGIGFYFKKDNSGYEHVPYPKTTSSVIRRALLNNIAFARYLLININAAEIMHKYPICKLWIDCAPDQKYAANVIEETEEENPKRYYHGYLATKYFLNNLSKVRSSLASRNKTIFVVDSDRHNIYDKKNTKSVYFDTQRKNFISEAKSMGFRVIDTEEIFIEDYKINKNKFEFINDNHWNKRGHRLVAERILTELKKIIND